MGWLVKRIASEVRANHTAILNGANRRQPAIGDRVSISTSRRAIDRPLSLMKPCADRPPRLAETPQREFALSHFSAESAPDHPTQAVARSEIAQAPPLSRTEARLPHRPVIDWAAVERDYRAGQQSLRQLGQKHGCSHSSIANRATLHQWPRERPRGHTAQRDEGPA